MVSENEWPKEDDQSNFGTGYEYQFSGPTTISVLVDGKWMIFSTVNEKE